MGTKIYFTFIVFLFPILFGLNSVKSQKIYIDYQKEKYFLSIIYCNCVSGLWDYSPYDVSEEIYRGYFSDRIVFSCNRSTARDFPRCITFIKNDNFRYAENIKLKDLKNPNVINGLLNNIHIELSQIEKILVILSLSDFQDLPIYVNNPDSLKNSIKEDIRKVYSFKIEEITKKLIANEFKAKENEILIFSRGYNYQSVKNKLGLFYIIFKFDVDAKFIESVEVIEGW